MPIPKLGPKGELPPGIHLANISEVEEIFGQANERRKKLMSGLKSVVSILKNAGVSKIYLNGSFTTTEEEPEDIDGCWSTIGVNLKKLDPSFWEYKSTEEFEKNRKEIKEKFGVDFFIAQATEGKSGKLFPLFFQSNINGEPKGLILITI